MAQAELKIGLMAIVDKTGEELSTVDVEYIIHLMDQNGDGVLEWHEFRNFMQGVDSRLKTTSAATKIQTVQRGRVAKRNYEVRLKQHRENRQQNEVSVGEKWQRSTMIKLCTVLKRKHSLFGRGSPSPAKLFTPHGTCPSKALAAFLRRIGTDMGATHQLRGREVSYILTVADPHGTGFVKYQDFYDMIARWDATLPAWRAQTVLRRCEHVTQVAPWNR